jgi:iron(III) transport system ATP-binding protein
MSDLTVESLTKSYVGQDNVIAVDNVSIDVRSGELLVLLGPSGCGKTTLLRCIAGLEDAQSGKISLDSNTVFDGDRGFNLPTHRRDIGMVFQNYSLWPHMTVRQNVEYPLKARGFRSGDRTARADDALRVVQCSHLSDRLPAMLSGGQQQRVALARALSPQPAIMLLDEPLSNLDALLRVDLRAQLRAIHRQIGFTGIYVTHDQAEAFNLGSRVAVMRAGAIEQLDTPDRVYQRPATEYVAKFLGIRNVLTVERQGNRWLGPAGELDGSLSSLGHGAGALTLYIRPDDVILSTTRPVSDRHILLGSGRVMDWLFSGRDIDFVIKAGNETLFVTRAASEHAIEPDSDVYLSCLPQSILVYSKGRLVEG